jgi:hypothetical protein
VSCLIRVVTTSGWRLGQEPDIGYIPTQSETNAHALPPSSVAGQAISGSAASMTRPVIRLFISSLSDVAAERRRAAMVAEQLNGEFAGRVRIEPILWEERFYSSHAGFQGQIAEAATGDIVAAVFGGRLDTRLPDRFPVNPATGQPYPSGTAYEVLSAIEAREFKGSAGHLRLPLSRIPGGARGRPRPR